MRVLILASLFLLTFFEANSQKVSTHNKDLLDTIWSFYQKDCIEVYKPEVTPASIENDIKLFQSLNLIFDRPSNTVDSLFIFKMGFYKGFDVLQSLDKRAISFHQKSEGNIIATITYYIDLTTKKATRKIFISTNTKFACTTSSTTLFNNVDFIYLRRIIHEIKFPLKLSNTITTLESID